MHGKGWESLSRFKIGHWCCFKKNGYEDPEEARGVN